MRIELQLDGLRSVVSAGFLALGESNRRIQQKFDEALGTLERIAKAIEDQTKLLTHSNGYAAGARQSID